MAFEWAIVGAGPAGIAAVGKLLDAGIQAEQIAWIDPEFKVGDLGTLWRNVPSNTKVGLFLKFLNAAISFQYEKRPKEFAIDRADPKLTCELNLVAEPLQYISDQLKERVVVREDYVETLLLKERAWAMELRSGASLSARNVILAIGAEPKQLSYTQTAIPLKDAMDELAIQKYLQADDAIAVFGSSHSAILVLRNLLTQNIKRVINFYRSPLRYAVYLDDWILFDDSGLKGPTAEWARQNLDGNVPDNLERYYANAENIELYLPQCNKVVYAVGFERRHLPVIKNLSHVSYIEQCGIIAPGLFGLGIAFPQAKFNPFGMLEYRVGLWKFMDYLNEILPIWMKYKT